MLALVFGLPFLQLGAPAGRGLGELAALFVVSLHIGSNGFF
jgi:hypothetical protein